MGPEYHPIPSVILIAPNVSEKMGGEAIKSLQIYQFLVDRGVDVQQITHSRVREELNHSFPEMKVIYIEETWLDYFLWKTKFLNYLLTPYFMYRAAQVARRLVAAKPDSVVHYTSPISPVTPMFPIPEARVVVGPLNGNIHHPLGFRARESLVEMTRRLGMVPCQWLHRLFFSGKQTADVILVAGGQRTYQSLKIAGCRDHQFHESLDSGIPDYLSETPPIVHDGVNYRFVHHGRLVAYKGADLSIKAVARARCPIELHVIGDGKERQRLEQLAAMLGISDRVHFTSWMKHEKLIENLRSYRGMVTPTLAEANGIVFQEAMMIGLPVICLDWGGPSLLVTPETGFLIPPRNEAQIIADLADRMDLLAEDGALANQMALKSRQVAMDRGYCWSQLIERWISIYCSLDLRSRSLPIKDTRPGSVVSKVESIRSRILALIFFGNDRQSRSLESKSEEIEFAP